MGSPHFHGGEQVLPKWEEVGRARFGQPWGGRLEGSVGHTGTPGDPREGKGRERNSPVGSPGGRREPRGSFLSHTATSFSEMQEVVLKKQQPPKADFTADAKEPFLILTDLLAMDLLIYNLNYSQLIGNAKAVGKDWIYSNVGECTWRLTGNQGATSRFNKQLPARITGWKRGCGAGKEPDRPGRFVIF